MDGWMDRTLCGPILLEIVDSAKCLGKYLKKGSSMFWALYMLMLLIYFFFI